MFLKNFTTAVGYFLAVPIFLLLLAACGSGGSSDPFAKCRYAKPVAIFSDSLSAVKQHQFELRENTGYEKVFFESGMELELFQSGCDNIKQEFRFSFPIKHQQDEPQFWIEQAIGLLNYMGNLSEKQKPFLMWSNMIRQQQQQMDIGEAFELEPGVFAKVDRILSDNNTMILLELSTR
ncbi:MAG: hypothetical protein AAF990_26130 [Bacteroidota bacterium]